MAGKGSKGAGEPKDKVEARILIIQSPYYEDVAKELMDGAVAELKARGAIYEVVSVPGALEIPQVLAQATSKMLVGGDIGDGIYDGVVVLGCVIRGETAHYDIVCNNANHWLMETSINFDVPLGNAILTVDNKEQAMARAKGGRKGKGGDAARACLRMIEVCWQFEEQGAEVMLPGLDFEEFDIEDLDIDEGALEELFLGGRQNKKLSGKKNGNGNGSKGSNS